MVAVREKEAVSCESQLFVRPRRDALPEHTQYLDTGCDIHASCLTCPLVRCRYDEPGGARRLLSEARDRSIVALQSRGDSISAIAERFGVSRRTVFRVLARSRPSTLRQAQGSGRTVSSPVRGEPIEPRTLPA